MTTAQTILEGAYNRSSANDPGKLAQDPELLLHLNRVYQRTWALVARARPDEFSSAATFVMAGGPAAITLPADTIDLLSIFQGSAIGARVHVIPQTEVDKLWHMAPSVYRRGLAVVTRNKGGDPAPGDTLYCMVLDAPVPLTALASVVDPRWPIRLMQLLVDYMACYLSVKDAGRSAEEHAKLLGELKADAAGLASEYQLTPEAVEWIHAEVARQAVPA